MLNLLGPASPHAPTGPGTASTEPHPRCRNCEERLPAPTPNYCPACGQETRLRAPTLREFAQQSGGHYVATEGALWRTLKLLVTQPRSKITPSSSLPVLPLEGCIRHLA